MHELRSQNFSLIKDQLKSIPKKVVQEKGVQSPSNHIPKQIYENSAGYSQSLIQCRRQRCTYERRTGRHFIEQYNDLQLPVSMSTSSLVHPESDLLLSLVNFGVLNTFLTQNYGLHDIEVIWHVFLFIFTCNYSFL